MAGTFPSASGGMWMPELPIPFAGRANLTHTSYGGNVSVWELKPSTWEFNPRLQKLASKQLDRYVIGVINDKISKGDSNFTVGTGTSAGGPLPFTGIVTAPVTDGIYNYVATYYIPNPETGMIYYSLSDKVLKPEIETAAKVAKTVLVVQMVAGVVVLGTLAAVNSGGLSIPATELAVVAILVSSGMMAQEQPKIDNKIKNKIENKTEVPTVDYSTYKVEKRTNFEYKPGDLDKPNSEKENDKD